MSQFLAKSFMTTDFIPERFVKDLSSQCIGAEELRHQRAKIQELAHSTSALLKRNVYQNYVQFIETAKEISHLESEMYQLSQLLSEQRSLISILNVNQRTGICIEDDFDDQDKHSKNLSKEKSKQKLLKLLENVEGAMSLIETPERVCLHDGPLIELDALENIPLRKIHAYLFKDVLMIASCLFNNNNRTLKKYRLQVVYDLQSLAIVNIRDFGNVKFAFKLLAFPDTRVFQCTSAINKKEWLEKCDQAKKLKSPAENFEPLDNIQPNTSESILLTDQALFSEQQNGIEVTSQEALPEWIVEITEDLDSCIAQHHFEEAYNLLKKAQEFLKNSQNSSKINYLTKLNNRTNVLVDVLTKELEMSAEAKSLQGGGLRSSKRAVKLLIQLNHSTQACHLYLMLCSETLKTRLKKIKREGSTVSYIKELSAVAFSAIEEMSRDFLKIFCHNSNCVSALLVWSTREFKLLISHLCKQIFIPQLSISLIATCLAVIRRHCEKLTLIGLDFRYQFDVQSKKPLIKSLEETKEKFIDTFKIRSVEDTWKPTYFQTIQNFDVITHEFEDLGIPIPQSLYTNQNWIPLTNNTLNFSKTYISLFEDCLSLYTPEILEILEEILYTTFSLQMQYLESCLINTKTQSEVLLIQDNMKYIKYTVLSRALELYKSVTGYSFGKLILFREQVKFETVAISSGRQFPKSTVSKYSTTEYL